MCIFSGAVERVSGTRIFARLDVEWQHLVYEMSLTSAAEVAMVLPLPVVPGVAEGVRFVSLEHYSAFFADLAAAFPDEGGDVLLGRAPVAAGQETLEVQQVGAFEASFVPARSEFGRLDARFRLSEAVWHALPGYHDFGFAVFQLRAGESRVHPMALSFRTREARSLYFPTVHVHDGTVPEWAAFDHALYAQGRLATNRDWASSVGALGASLRQEAAGLVAPDQWGYRRLLYGTYENRDTRVALDG